MTDTENKIGCGAGWTVTEGGHSGCFLGILRDGIVNKGANTSE